MLTNNFDPEYGNYNGGMINVVTKSGSNAFHGDAFEFLRNTDLDAKNYFDAPAASSGRISSAARSAAPIKQGQTIFLHRLSGNRRRPKASLRREHRALRSGPRRQLLATRRAL